MSDRTPSGGGEPRRASLAVRLRELEVEIQRAQAELASLGGEMLLGLYLVVRAAGRRALIASTRVREVVRLVETRPLPGAPAHVLGTFLCRGLPVIAVHLGTALGGAQRAPELDAQIAMLAGAPAVDLVVERIEGLIDGPRLFDGERSSGTPESWRGSPLVAGLCVHDGEVLPLLDPAPLVAALRGTEP